MDTDALTPGLLQELRATRPYPALSLTMPTLRRTADDGQDAVRLRNLVAEAGNRLDTDPGVSRAARIAMKAQLDRAVNDVDPLRTLDSLVILADADEYQIWQLPRTAPARVVLSDSYLTRNLVAAKAGAQWYWVLSLSAEHATLFSGTNDGLQPAPRGGFPLTAPHEEPNPQRKERIGDTPSIYTSEDTRHFMRTVDEALHGVLTRDPRPLLLVGLAPALSLLDDVGESAKPAVGRVAKGTTADMTAPELAKDLGPALRDWRKQTAARIQERLDNAHSSRTFAGGLDEVWLAVREGRAGLIAVEEHFKQTVRITDGHLEPVGPDVTPATDDQVREDIVDELVEAALDNGCEVSFVADDSLADHGRIAAVLRF